MNRRKEPDDVDRRRVETHFLFSFSQRRPHRTPVSLVGATPRKGQMPGMGGHGHRSFREDHARHPAPVVVSGTRTAAWGSSPGGGGSG